MQVGNPSQDGAGPELEAPSQNQQNIPSSGFRLSIAQEKSIHLIRQTSGIATHGPAPQNSPNQRRGCLAVSQAAFFLYQKVTGDQAERRRKKKPTIPPKPSRAQVAGSGTEVTVPTKFKAE